MKLCAPRPNHHRTIAGSAATVFICGRLLRADEFDVETADRPLAIVPLIFGFHPDLLSREQHLSFESGYFGGDGQHTSKHEAALVDGERRQS